MGFPAYNPMMPMAQPMRPVQPWGQPTASTVRPGLPGQTTVPMDPRTLMNPALNPLEAAQKMLGPEQAAKLQQMLQDPAVRQQMQQFAMKAQQGLLRPEDLQQLAINMPQALASADDLTPGKLLAALVGATATGMLFSKGLNVVMDTHKKPGGFITKVLKAVDHVPFVKTFNDKINAQVAANAHPVMAHPWLGLQGGVDAETTIKQYLQAFVNPKTGHLKEEIKKLGLPSPLIDQITQATTRQDLQRALEMDPLHLLPANVEGLVVYRPGMTLQSIEHLAHREAFFQQLGSLDTKDALKLKKALDLPWFQKIPVISWFMSKPPVEERFYSQFQELLKQNSDLAKTLKKITGLQANATSEQIAAHIVKQAGSRWQPVCQVVQANLGKIASEPMAISKATTLDAIKAHLEEHHYLKRIKGSERKAVTTFFTPMLRKLSFLSGHHVPVIGGKHAFYTSLDKAGVGPVGKLLGKGLFHLQRILDGANVNVMTNFGNKLIQDKPSLIGRAWISLLIMGFAFLGYQTAPKESKKSRFAEGLATGIFDYLGFEMTRNWLTETGLLVRNPKVACFLNKSFLWKFTREGFVREMLLPMLVASVFGKVATSVSHVIFGNPETIEAEVARKKAQAANPQAAQQAQKQQPAGVNQSSAQANAASPASLPPAPADLLSPQTTGLTPAQIALSTARLNSARATQTLLGEEPHFEQMVSGEIWAH